MPSKLVIVLTLVAVAVIAGVFSSYMLVKPVEKGESMEKGIRMRYIFTLPLYDQDYEFDIIKYGNETKIVTYSDPEYPNYYTAVFKTLKIPVACYSYRSSLHCDIEDVETATDFTYLLNPIISQELLDNAEVSEISITGRSCNNFHLRINESTYRTFYPGDISFALLPLLQEDEAAEEILINFNICKDTKLNSTNFIKAYASHKNEPVLDFTVSLKEFASDVEKSDVEVPIPFYLKDVECHKDRLDIVLIGLRNDLKAVLTVNISHSIGSESHLITSDFEFGKEKRFTVDLIDSMKENIHYAIKVCEKDTQNCGEIICLL